jgi:SAM-dependent methyltransferase
MADPSERQLVTTIYKNITAELPEACSILSVGVGTGAIAGLFAENGYSVTGVDITPEVLTIAAQKGIRTIEADAGENAFWEMDEHSTKYGAVIFSESLEYFDEPEKVFKMARKVLCEKGKIYVLARNIPGNRREEKYEKALKEAGFRIKSGAARMLFGNNAGMRMLSGEMLPARRADKKEIIKRIEKIIPRLIHDMMSLETANSTDVNIAGRADYVPGKKEDKKIVILIDKDLSGMNNNTDIIRSVKNLINTLAGIKGNNSELAVFLENLEIIPVEGGSIERGGRFRQYKNIIAVTRTSNKSFFENINTEIIVAAIEDKDFPEKAYLPLIEVTLFAIGKFLKLEQALLEQYYQNIPDVKSLKELKESGEFSDIFDPDVKTFVIQLPHARSFNTSKSLVETMEIIRGLLRKA